MLEDAGGEVEKEHCKGMEGLCKEALTHGVKEASEDGELKDIVIVTQYQRMCYYGITWILVRGGDRQGFHLSGI